MRDVVRKAFYEFNSPMEGEVPFFYQDVKGLVSIGVGLLCDPIELAMGLPLIRPDGAPASRAEIVAEWTVIKNLPPSAKGQTAAQLGHLYARPHTKLRLTPEGLRQSLVGKLSQMDGYLANRFRCTEHEDCRAHAELGSVCTGYGYNAWGADAQLATLSMAWACGPAFRFPKLEAALRRLDFRTAAVECFMPEEKTISGLRPRNRANRILFTNAAIALNTLDPDVLFWPADLEAQRPETKTQPSIVSPDQLEPEAETVTQLPGRELDPNE
jgi:hypothetical protein